jgi:MYXO-CTERM domain-containing protein
MRKFLAAVLATLTIGTVLGATVGTAGAAQTATQSLNRYVDTSDSSVHWTTTNASQVPAGFTEEGTLGLVYPDPGPGLVALYNCRDGGDGNYLSIDQSGSCEGNTQPNLVTHSLGIDGYVYATQPTDGTTAVELYRCFRPSPFDHFATTVVPVTVNGQQRCGEDPTDYAAEGSLGWIVASQPGSATPEVPLTVILPLVAFALLGGVFWRRRRQAVAHSTE